METRTMISLLHFETSYLSPTGTKCRNFNFKLAVYSIVKYFAPPHVKLLPIHRTFFFIDIIHF